MSFPQYLLKKQYISSNILTSCFGCSGQRCIADSVIACVGKDTYKRAREAFVEAADKLIVVDPLDSRYKDEGVLVGPVISSQAKQRILKAIKDAKKEGCSILLDKSGVKIKGRQLLFRSCSPGKCKGRV
ncbi:MAG: aldehyde dehydrogenase family protein [Candidatus Humimicrobiaceae bacterium]